MALELSVFYHIGNGIDLHNFCLKHDIDVRDMGVTNENSFFRKVDVMSGILYGKVGMWNRVYFLSLDGTSAIKTLSSTSSRGVEGGLNC